jgi:hypothetical protein
LIRAEVAGGQRSLGGREVLQRLVEQILDLLIDGAGGCPATPPPFPPPV